MPCILVVVVIIGWAMETSAKNGNGKGKPPPEVPYTVIDSGSFSHIDTMRLAVVRDQAAWNALWADHADGTPPAVDFGNDLVIGIFLGMRGSDRYRVVIDRIFEMIPATPRTDENGDEITDPDYFVEFVEEIRDGIADDIMTNPVSILVVPATEGAILFGWDVVNVGKNGKGKGKDY
ncbi:MAG: hypothetical protein ACYTG6_17330 [Planctomycetota bacterium]